MYVSSYVALYIISMVRLVPSLSAPQIFIANSVKIEPLKLGIDPWPGSTCITPLYGVGGGNVHDISVTLPWLICLLYAGAICHLLQVLWWIQWEVRVHGRLSVTSWSRMSAS